MGKKATHDKLLYFEGLRGIAAMHVVWAHTMGYWGSLREVLMYYQGWTFSVPMFFTMSGGIITRSILRSHDYKRLFSSVVRRPFRFLLPLYGCALFFWLLAVLGLVPESAGIQTFQSLYQLLSEPAVFLLIGRDIPKFLPGPVWTLPEEMKGSLYIYLVTAILIPYSNNARVRYTVLVSMFLWFFFTDSWCSYFICGYMISDAAESGLLDRFRKWKYGTVTKATVFACSCLMAFTYFDNPIPKFFMDIFGTYKLTTAWNFPLHSVILPFCVVSWLLIETSPFLRQLLSHRLFVYLGEISFMLYLIHSPVAKILEPYSKNLQETYGDLGKLLRFLFEHILFIAVADILTRYYDVPVQKLLRDAEKWLFAEMRPSKGGLLEEAE
ncbi:hypothetical protein HDU97_005634 [Phlyctochytrium planicorne]|nr:hypothetical protein HDU97_005634 [Phlyctochytrium planicorne]